MIISLAEKIEIVSLSIEKIPKNDLNKYLDFANIFSKRLALKLLKYLDINKYIINLEISKSLPYRPIYSF